MAIISPNERPYISRAPDPLLNSIDTSVDRLKRLMNEAIQGNYEGLTIACQNIQKIAELLKEWPDKTLSWILVQDANYIGSLHYDLFKLHRDKSLLGTPQYEMSVRKIKTTIVHLEQIKEQIDPPVNLVNESSPLLQSTQRKMMYSQE